MAISFWTETRGNKLIGVVDRGQLSQAQIEVRTKGSARWWVRKYCQDPKLMARLFADITNSSLPASRTKRR